MKIINKIKTKYKNYVRKITQSRRYIINLVENYPQFKELSTEYKNSNDNYKQGLKHHFLLNINEQQVKNVMKTIVSIVPRNEQIICIDSTYAKMINTNHGIISLCMPLYLIFTKIISLNLIFTKNYFTVITNNGNIYWVEYQSPNKYFEIPQNLIQSIKIVNPVLGREQYKADELVIKLQNGNFIVIIAWHRNDPLFQQAKRNKAPFL